MAIIELTNDTIEQTLNDNDIVIIDFWAPWCGPCKQFAPIFEAACAEHDDVTFAKVNTDEQQELAAGASISSIPTIMIFREAIPVFRQSGALSQSAIADLIKQVKELDMDDVRKQLADNN